MAKFAGTSVKPGQATEVEKAALALPAQEIKEQTPQAEPEVVGEVGGSFGKSFIDQLKALPEETAAETVGEATGAGVEAGLQVEEQLARERVPTLAERAQVPLHETQAWNPKLLQTDAAQPRTDGGLKARASNMAAIFGGTDPSTKLGITPSTAASREAAAAGDVETVAALEAEVQGGSLIAALNRSGAVNSTQNPETRSWTNEVDPIMLQVGSAVTENMFSDAAFGDTDVDITAIDPEQPTPTVTKAQGNSRLGQEIHREYMRMKNQREGRPTDDYTDLPREEATTLGDAFKEMWAIANPTLINRAEAGGQVNFQLTPEGVEAMKNGAVDRKRLFPKKNVQPLKAPVGQGIQAQLPGEQGRTVVKKTSGKVKQPLVGAQKLQEAARNLQEVPNVVDKQREKILYATVLPVLSGQLDWTSWEAEINNIGEGKMVGFQAAEAAYLRRVQEGVKGEAPYVAQNELESLTNKIAQEVQSVAQNRDGANYLTYNIQTFNGRMSPQQSYFDPTTSKAVRFVTRNAVPAPAAPNSRVASNLEQMYAMMLIKDADALLPKHRLEAFEQNASQLEKDGDRLAEVLENSITDAQADAIAEHIANGGSLTDGTIQVPTLQLDPVQDADLIKRIKKKGEDGPHYIDGLIDAAKYIKAKRRGDTYHSYFNAYVDGKTNGIASNGIQMGSEEVARATGVIRNNTRELLDNGDIRDQLKSNLLERLEEVGFEGTMQDAAPELYNVAREVYGIRNLNKATTMTFSYGKELASFKEDVGQFMNEHYETSKQRAQDQSLDPDDRAAAAAFVQSLDKLRQDQKWGEGKVIDTLHKFYVGSLAEVLSEDAIKSRSLMRSAAMMHALTDQLFTIKSATGFELNMGGEATLGFDAETATTYTMNQDGRRTKVTAGQYETYSTASAIRKQTDAEGNISQTPGEDAYGGSVPGPVQSLDAATVALSAAGKSWEKMKAASNGNPYMHTIYDAFKLDAMGFDVGVKEINDNWFNSSFNWSYLEETHAATKEKMTNWAKQFNNIPADTQIPITLQGTASLADGTPFSGRMMGWLLEPQETASGKSFPTRLGNKLRNLVDGETEAQRENVAKEAVDRVLNAVRESGVNIWGLQDGSLTHVTARQYRVFVTAMAKELNVGNRLESMINSTNAKKKRLKKVIDAQKHLHGNEILQYYAH